MDCVAVLACLPASLPACLPENGCTGCLEAQEIVLLAEVARACVAVLMASHLERRLFAMLYLVYQ
jgi:hypothetical protein